MCVCFGWVMIYDVVVCVGVSILMVLLVVSVLYCVC